MNLFLNDNSSVFIKSGCTAKVKNTIKIVYLIVVILSHEIHYFVVAMVQTVPKGYFIVYKCFLLYVRRLCFRHFS